MCRIQNVLIKVAYQSTGIKIYLRTESTKSECTHYAVYPLSSFQMYKNCLKIQTHYASHHYTIFKQYLNLRCSGVEVKVFEIGNTLVQLNTWLK